MKVEDSLTTIVQQMKSVCKPMQRFLLTLSQAFVCVRGRNNFRNLARYVPFCEHTISRQFGKKFDFSEFACLFFDLFFPKDTFIVALDATFIPKSGKHTFGKDKFFSSTQGKAVGGLELSLLSLISIEKQTAFSFQLRQSWTAVKDKLVFYLEQIEKVKISLLKKTTFLVADGYYAKHAFVEGICQMEFTFISKLRSDANLRWLYQSQDSQPQDSQPQKKKRGRKKVYAGKVLWSDPTLWEKLTFVKELENGVSLYTAVCDSVSLKRQIRLVILQQKESTHKGKEKLCLLFSTDCQQDAQQVYQFYQLRFQIEFLFRDAKTHLGLEHCQSRQEHKLDFHFNFVFLLLNLLKYQLIQQGKTVLSIADLKTAYFNHYWLDTIFSKLEIDTNLIKKHPSYNHLLNWGLIAD